jgi:hypothetical protein
MDVYRRFWGFGVVQAAFQAVSDMGLSWSAVSNLMQESVIGKYKISNLKKLLLSKDYAAIEQRMQNLELSKNILHGVLLGEDEEYTRDKLEFTGVADVLDRFMMRLSSEVNIPVALLFGRGAAGMNATGEGDARQYYDGVKATQDELLRNPLESLAVWIGARMHPDVDPEEYHVVFREVWSMSEKERAEVYYKLAQGDALNKVNGVLSPKEIRAGRFLGRYSPNMSVPADATEPPPDPLMLQLAGGDMSPNTGTHEGGTGSPKASASEAPPLPDVNTKELTKVRNSPESFRNRGGKSGPNSGRQQNGVSQAGATKVHSPRAGNSTTGDEMDAFEGLLAAARRGDAQAMLDLSYVLDTLEAADGSAE